MEGPGAVLRAFPRRHRPRTGGEPSNGVDIAGGAVSRTPVRRKTETSPCAPLKIRSRQTRCCIECLRLGTRSTRLDMKTTAPIIAFAVVALAVSIRADVLTLKDGTKLEGDVKKTDLGYDVRSADGKVTHVPSDRIAS